jgi:serine/threonine-protein kinase
LSRGRFGRIGQGGQAVVWAATWDQVPGRELAIKFLSPRWSANPRMIDQFRAEAQTALDVNPDFLVPIRVFLDLGDFPDWPPVAIVMDRYPCSLAQVIDSCGQQRRIPGGLVARWMRNVLSGLDFLHTRGLVHRDLKPGNVLLQLKGGAFLDLNSLEGSSARIADLGVVAPSGQVPTIALGQDRGRHQYKDPELFDPAGNPRADVPANPHHDIYSFGVMIRELEEVTRADL